MTALETLLEEISNCAESGIFVTVERPEGYEDVHEELVLEDFATNPKAWSYSLLPASHPKTLVAIIKRAVEALESLSVPKQFVSEYGLLKGAAMSDHAKSALAEINELAKGI